MSRRKSVPVNRHVNGERSSIGDDTVNSAVLNCVEAMHIEIAMNIEKEFSAMQMLHMFFPDDLADRLKAVRHCVTPVSQTGHYPVGGAGLMCHINWEKTGIPTPAPDALAPHAERMGLFFAAIDTCRTARMKYGKVVHLLRWFNRNATPSAIRNYWPSALALTPGSNFARDNAEPPSRYTTPNGIGGLLPLLRETAGTVAGMQLIPSDLEGRSRGQVWLTFEPTEIITEDNVSVPLDIVNVNL